MIFVRRTQKLSIDRVLLEAASHELTYSQIGATFDSELPTGFHHLHRTVQLGVGSLAFEKAKRGLRTWQLHKIPGVRVYPVAPIIALSTTVVVTIGAPFAAIAAPCRITRVVDDKSRYGFAYGTLPGHPEKGEEAFIVSLQSNNEVILQLTAFSAPGTQLTRVAGPLGRGFQCLATEGYARAMRSYMARPD